MHKFKFIISLITLILATQSIIFSQQQSLYTPLNIQNAYEAKTRSTDGNPGSAYWQNHSDYEIDVKIDPTTNILTGSETITYYNESPDTLYKLVFRLYNDIYHAGNSRDFAVSEKGLLERVKIKTLLINDEEVLTMPGMIHRTATNLSVALVDYLYPGKKIKVYVEWSLKIPAIRQIRMGSYSEHSKFVAYWYPQISVYDDIDGWDSIEYYGRAEFYNDFNNYKFNVEVPEGYVVWATGDLKNQQEVFHEDIIEKINEAKQSDEVIQIISPDDYDDDEVTILKEKNIWKFEAAKVPDVTLAISKNYVWDAGSVLVDSAKGRRVLVSAVYPDSIEQFKEVANFSLESIKYLSHDLPAVPYPYSHVTTFCNSKRSGGMESPMMANNGAPDKRSSMVGLVFHEIAHNYFPFYMGINERKYAWMEEGWAAFLPAELVKRITPEFDYMSDRTETYVLGAGDETDPPPMVPTFSIARSPEFRNASYNRPSVAYNLLMNYFGKEKFRNILQEYINRWNGKHPTPNDFFYTFNLAAEENLNWFWKPWFFEIGYPDLGIKNVEQTKLVKRVTIEKIGSLPVPIKIKVIFDDNTEKIFSEKMNVWSSEENEFIINVKSEEKIKSVELGSSLIPDVNKQNNRVEF